MQIIANKKLIALALALLSLPAFAGSGGGAGSVFSVADAVAAFSVAESLGAGSIPSKPMFQRPGIGKMILGGMLGNLVGSVAGIYAGAQTFDEDNPWTIISCWAAGSALGSALGAALAGNSANWRGSFGLACVGGVLGVGATWLIVSSPTFQEKSGLLLLVPMAVLPPVAAAVFYRKSLRLRRFPLLGAMLNLSAGRLALGVPDIQVRPLLVPGGRARPGLQFNVKVLSVEL